MNFIINTKVNLSDLQQKDFNTRSVLETAGKLPLNFSWVENIDGNAEPTFKYNLPLTHVGNQGACGSCWAFSTATALSDLYVIKQYKTKKGLGKSGKIINPNLSAMWILANFQKSPEIPKSFGCNGGSLGLLANWLEKNGVATNACIDYYYITKQSEILKDKKTKVSPEIENKFNNDIFSQNNKCVNTSVEHYLFKNKNPYAINLSTLNNDVSSIQIPLKTHIYNNGTALTGFLVLESFMPKKNPQVSPKKMENCFESTNGIFFDCWNYVTNKPMSGQDIQNNKIIGGHAVCIVGWVSRPIKKNIVDSISNAGYEFSLNFKNYVKNLHTNPKDSSEYLLNCWIVRNSWGSKWCNNGYVYYPFAPMNYLSPLEVPKEIMDENSGIGNQASAASSGVCYFECDMDSIEKIDSEDNISKENNSDFIDPTNTSYYSKNYKDFSNQSVNPTTKKSGSSSGVGAKTNIALIIGIVIGILLLCVLIYLTMRKIKRSKR